MGTKRDPEQAIALNIRRYRQRKGWSQEELAQHMSREGFPWRQTTVAKTEAGRRPIRVNEFTALTRVLGVGMGQLMAIERSPEVSEATTRLLEIQAAMTAKQGEIQRIDRELTTLTTELARVRTEHDELNKAWIAQSQVLNELSRGGEQKDNG